MKFQGTKSCRLVGFLRKKINSVNLGNINSIYLDETIDKVLFIYKKCSQWFSLNIQKKHAIST